MLGELSAVTCVQRFSRLIDRAAAKPRNDLPETHTASDKYVPGHASGVRCPVDHLPTVHRIERNAKLCSQAFGTIAIAGGWQ